MIPENTHEFEFLFFHSDEPFYVLHHLDHFDITMLHMLLEFEVDVSDIKEWNITKL